MRNNFHETKLNDNHGTIYGGSYCIMDYLFFESDGTIYHRLSRWTCLKWKLKTTIFKLKTKIYFTIERLFRLLRLI